MNITIDMGNTNIFVGVYKDGTLVHTFRTLTDKSKSYDEYLSIFNRFISEKNLIEPCDGAILSSVVPSLNKLITSVVKETFKTEVKTVGPGLKTGLKIKMDNPSEVGADLVCDCVGALQKYGPATLIVDLGTASKIIVLDKDGCFVGGVVMAGIMIATKALTNQAALLSEVSLECPEKVIGKNTPDSVNSGSIYGTIAMIEGLCTKIENELGYKCQRILTGGYAPLVRDHLNKDFVHDSSLVLDGLFFALKKNIK